MTEKGKRDSEHWPRILRAIKNGELNRRGARSRLAEELGISRQRLSEMIALADR